MSISTNDIMIKLYQLKTEICALLLNTLSSTFL